MLRKGLKGAARLVRLASTLAIMVSLVSCAGHESATPSDLTADQLVGRDVRITTTEGRVLEFTVTSVTDEAILGESERVEREDVDRLELQSHARGGVVGQAVGTAMAALWVAAVAGIFYGLVVFGR